MEAHVAQLEQLMKQAKDLVSKADGSSMPEIEVRFGTINPKTQRYASAGLPASQLQELMQEFSESDCWSSTIEWQRSHVSHFVHNGTEFRAETLFAADGVRKSIMQKTTVGHVDAAIDNPNRTTPLDCAVIGVRVAVATETPVDPTSAGLPPVVYPDRVFVKDRRTFLFGNRGGTVNWAYTLTRRWEGASLEDAYANVKLHPDPLIEIEIECVNIEYLAKHSAMYLAKSLICKIGDMRDLLFLKQAFVKQADTHAK